MSAAIASLSEHKGRNSDSITHVTGLGLRLDFQDGPVPEHGENGTTNEAVIQVLIDRLTSLNEMDSGRFACVENHMAIFHLGQAKHALDQRTRARERRGVEGTNIP